MGIQGLNMFKVRAYLIQAYLICFDLTVIAASYVPAWQDFSRLDRDFHRTH